MSLYSSYTAYLPFGKWINILSQYTCYIAYLPFKKYTQIVPQNTSYITYLPFRKYTQMVPQNTSNLTYLPFQKVDAYLAPPYLFVVCLPLLLSAVLEASSLAECAASRATSGISSSAACSDSDLVLGCADWLGVSSMGAEEDVEVF